MNVHLVRSNELSRQTFWEIYELVSSFPGPVKFQTQEEEFLLEDMPAKEVRVVEEDFFKCIVHESKKSYGSLKVPEVRLQASWDDLFALCEKYREYHSLPKSDLVILLTSLANENNWFSTLDPENKNNGFIHTDEWDFYIHSQPIFPVSYLIASKILQREMFSSMKELMKAVHKEPLGCINDFCQEKKQIVLKLRTADVCHKCMNILKEKKVDLPLIRQAQSIMEGVRLRMLFSQNFKQNLTPSRLRINRKRKIFLPDYGNIEVKLTPLEKTLFLLYLRHPNGIEMHNLVDHKNELVEIYGDLSGTIDMASLRAKVEQLVDLTTNSASEKISKVKSAFIKAVGEDLAAHYYIQGKNAEVRKIPLDRALVENE